MKDNEILTGRLQMLEMIQPIVGKFVSEDYVMRNILRLSTEEILKEQEKIFGEQQNALYDTDGTRLKQKSSINRNENDE